MKFRSLSLLTAALLCPTAFAQINPNLGANLMAGDDQMVPVTLSFGFTFPDGTSQTALFVDSNGRVVYDAAESSDFGESVSDLLSDPSQIAVTWDDMAPNNAATMNDGLFFNDLGTSALITWNNCPIFGGAINVTAQLELFPDGSFSLTYGNDLPSNHDYIAGCSQGNGAADPGASDLSAGVMSAGDPTVYEQFSFSTSAVDLAGATVTFTPDGSGGYDVVTTTPPFGTATLGDPGCIGPNITFSRDGSGGYNVAAGGTFDDTFATGTALGLGDDSVSDQNAGFPFLLPDGTPSFNIRIDSNGRISNTAAGESSDFNLSVVEFLAESASIAAAADFSPNAGGEVWFMQTTYGCAVTWAGVPEFGESDSNTFQIQLLFDGSIVFCFRGMDVDADFLVGVSAGGGAPDPGEIDVTAGAMSGGVSEVYEFFDLPTDTNDLNVDGPILSALTSPSIGTSFDLQISNAPDSIGDFILVGLPSFLDVGAVFPGAGYDGCFTYVDLATDLVGVLAPGGVFSLAVPNDGALIGVSLVGQGILIDPVNRPQVLNLNFTNSLNIEIGV